MADVTMTPDLVRHDGVANFGTIVRHRREAWVRRILKRSGVLVERLLVWISAKLEIWLVVAFIAITFALIQTGMIRALLWLPIAIFG